MILATVTSGNAMTPVLGGLGLTGKFIVLGATAEPVHVNTMGMLGARHSLTG